MAGLVAAAGMLLGGLNSGATAAAAGTSVASNACLYSFDDVYRDVAVTLTANPATARAAPGQSVALSGGSIQLALPAWLGEYGYNLGFYKAGANTIPVTVWVALSASNTAQGTQVVQIDTTVSTTITVDGGAVKATSLAVSRPLPVSTWTAASEGTISFAQAEAGGLGQLTDILGASVTPGGSLFVSAALGSGKLNLDCRPGEYAQQGKSYASAPAQPFAQVTVAATDAGVPTGRTGLVIAAVVGGIGAVGYVMWILIRRWRGMSGRRPV